MSWCGGDGGGKSYSHRMCIGVNPEVFRVHETLTTHATHVRLLGHVGVGVNSEIFTATECFPTGVAPEGLWIWWHETD